MIRRNNKVHDHGLISTLTPLHRVHGLDKLPLDVDIVCTPLDGNGRIEIAPGKIPSRNDRSDHVALIPDIRIRTSHRT
jgi:hypothetical protein